MAISPTGFIQTSSLAKHLKATFLAIALLFLVGFLGNLYSSRTFLAGLTEVNVANNLLEMTTQTRDSLNAAVVHVQKLREAKEIEDARFAYLAGVNKAQEILDKTIVDAAAYPEEREGLLAAKEGIRQYRRTVDAIFAKLRTGGAKHMTPSQEGAFARDLFIANQFAADTRDALRHVQIVLKRRSDRSFDAVYGMRHVPLIASIVLAVICFMLVIVSGFSASRRLERSLRNLSRATDAVARENLSYRATILRHDEFGKLTHEFNEMVKSLREGRDRTDRLHEVTAAFTEALSPHQVAEVILRQGNEALGANSGSVATRADEESDQLSVVRMTGMSEEGLARWRKVPLEVSAPMVDAFRTGKPIFIERHDELHARYPLIDTYGAGVPHAVAALPLSIGGRPFGVVSFRFDYDRRFSREDREFALALARQCAQALYRAQLFDRAQKAVRARDEFLSVASHELRTPLTSLKLQAQMAKRNADRRSEAEAFAPAKMRQFVELTDRSVERLSRLVADMLDISRIATGKLTMQAEPFDLAELAREVVERMSPQFQAARVAVSIEGEDSLRGSWDRFRIEQVITNLLTNAIRYGEGAPIHVSIWRSGEDAELSVRDEGPGIAPEHQTRVFERFERAVSANAVSGLGLGLYICRQILETHGGTIRLESAPGRGAEFIVRIPIQAPARFVGDTRPPPPPTA